MPSNFFGNGNMMVAAYLGNFAIVPASSQPHRCARDWMCAFVFVYRRIPMAIVQYSSDLLDATANPKVSSHKLLRNYQI